MFSIRSVEINIPILDCPPPPLFPGAEEVFA